MFNKKYNPDINNEYKNSENKRNNTKYKLKNIPYKIIINESTNKIIKHPEDLKIKLNNNNNNIKNEYNKILKDRNIKENNKKLSKKKYEIIKNEFKIKNTELICSEETNDFEDIKDNFKSTFIEEQKNLTEDRNKFNSIIESLLNDNLI